jgi:hypothetical protein
VASREGKLQAKPVRTVEADQKAIPTPAVNLVPDRSVHMPDGIRNSVYVQRKDEKIYPRATEERWNSDAIGFAAKLSEIRSM